MGKTGGGVGSNQYQVRGRSLIAPAGATVARPMGVDAAQRYQPLWAALQPGRGKVKKPTTELARAVRSKQCPAALIRLAVDSGHVDWMRAVASNPYVPDEILERLAHSSKDDVVDTGFMGSWAIEGASRAYAVTRIREKVAANRGAPASLLQELSTDPAAVVRWSVGLNRSAPPEILSRLLHDPKTSVAQRTAHNPNCSPEMLAEASKRSHANVRKSVSANPSTPTETMREMLLDKREAVRVKVATNPNCPPEMLAEMLADPSPSVRWAVLRHPRTPPHFKAIAALGR